MKPRSLLFITALLVATPALAQNPHGRQRDPGPAPQGAQAGPREAVPRNDPAPREAAPPPPPSTAAPAGRSSQAPDESATAQRRRSPDNDGVRRAVPRGSRPIPPPSGRGTRPYYYYPRYSYPYGYGAFGLGYFYYDPYLWGPGYGGYYDPYYGAGGPYYGGGGGNYYASGELRLEVKPRDAEVYIDGYFAGTVDDFDGVFQSLTIEEGPHRVRIVAPGFEPLEFDVRVFAGRKISYKGELLQQKP
jgi:hypothetical protein